VNRILVIELQLELTKLISEVSFTHTKKGMYCINKDLAYHLTYEILDNKIIHKFAQEIKRQIG